MTVHAKTALVLLTTLVIGTVFGALISVTVFRERRPLYFIGPPTPERFMSYWTRIIKPEDEAQREQIERIIQDHTGRFAGMMARHRAEIAAMLDSLQQDLRPVLNEEQLKQLNRRRMTPRPRRYGPGPPGE